MSHRQPLLHCESEFNPIWSGFHDAILRPTLMIIKDESGRGFRPATNADFGNLLHVSGVVITGIWNAEQVNQICSSGNVDSGNNVFVSSSGQLHVLAAQSGEYFEWLRGTFTPIDVSGRIGLSGGFVGLSGVSNVHLDCPVQVSGLPLDVSGRVGLSGGYVGISGTAHVELAAPVQISGLPLDVSGQVGLSGGYVGISGTAHVELTAPVQISGLPLDVSGRIGLSGGYIGISGTAHVELAAPIQISGLPLDVSGQVGLSGGYVGLSGTSNVNLTGPIQISGMPLDVSGSVGLSGGFVGISGTAHMELAVPIQVSGILDVTGRVGLSGGYVGLSGTSNVNIVAPVQISGGCTIGVTGNNGAGLDVLDNGTFKGLPVYLASGDTIVEIYNSVKSLSSGVKNPTNIVISSSGTGVQGPDFALDRGVRATAHPDNQGFIYLGGSGVTASGGAYYGTILVPGGMTPDLIPVKNTNQIYINGDYAGDQVGLFGI